MKKMIVLNHKMNLLLDDVLTYVEELKTLQTDYDLVICPSSLYLPYFKQLPFSLGIQNIYYEEKGSFTGEISCAQAASLGVKYLLIGHSERRKYFNEEEKAIHKKLEKAIIHDMRSIFCIGEENKNEENVMNVLKTQIDGVFTGLSDLKNITIAYEPVWAIGSGYSLNSNDIQKIIIQIKEYCLKKYQTNIPVLYGGSVDQSNFLDIITIKEVDGVLIGTYSIKSSNVVDLLTNKKRSI